MYVPRCLPQVLAQPQLRITLLSTPSPPLVSIYLHRIHAEDTEFDTLHDVRHANRLGIECRNVYTLGLKTYVSNSIIARAPRGRFNLEVHTQLASTEDSVCVCASFPPFVNKNSRLERVWDISLDCITLRANPDK